MPETIYHKDFVGVYDNALSSDECGYIIDEFKSAEENENIKVFSGADSHGGELSRQDFSIAAVDFSIDVHNLVGSRLHECLSLYCETYFMVKNIEAHSTEVKVQRTPVRGGYHAWHCEHGKKDADRILAWTIYLNDIPYNEGETEFLWQGIRINPKAGRCAIWPAAFTHTHRGNPVYTHDKYIATGWYTLI
jgi:hypothetical protein